MKNKLYKPYLLGLIMLLISTSCEEFLDAKPNRAIVTMDSLSDLQGLLDNTLNVMNREAFLQLFSSDEFYTDNNGLIGMPPYQQLVFTYRHPPFEQDLNLLDWRNNYTQIFYCNVVLDEIPKIVPQNRVEETQKNEITGQAHFHRAYAYYGLLQLFAPQYNPGGENLARTIPFRKVSDPTVAPEIPTLEEFYALMISDLENSVELLPDINTPVTRPSKRAAYAMLARTYLTMGDYQQAKANAQLALAIDNSLIDFNELNLSILNPFTQFNTETVFYSEILFSPFLGGQLAMVNPEYLNLYAENDLRRKAYFTERPTGWVNFTGFLTGTNRFYSGLSTGELYLIVSECLIREGNLDHAIALLSEFYQFRFPGDFQIIPDFTNETEGLQFIQDERRRELYGRGTVWTDIRRFNLDPRFARTISKNIEGVFYELPPNDPRSVLPIPPREIELDEL